MPDVKTLTDLTWDGVRYQEGDTLTVDDATAQRWEGIGLAQKAEAKKPAVKPHKPAETDK